MNNNIPESFQALLTTENKFTQIVNSTGGIVNWLDETIHVKNILAADQDLFDIAQKNKRSLLAAFMNVASIDLTLNPAMQYAYLIKQKNEIRLFVSYRGLIKLATSCGSILRVKAVDFYMNDVLEYSGPYEKIIHKVDFKKSRGDFIGVYCVAVLPDKSHINDVMVKAEIDEIKTSSKGFKSPYSPWQRFYNEMAKKAVIKRAAKLWPPGNKNRLQNAIQIINENEGIENTMNNNDSNVSSEMQNNFYLLMDNGTDIDMYIFQQICNAEQWGYLLKSFKAPKTEKRNKVENMVQKGLKQFQESYVDWVEARHKQHDLSVDEIEMNLGPHGTKLLYDLCKYKNPELCH